jgi:hypothetical protein
MHDEFEAVEAYYKRSLLLVLRTYLFAVRDMVPVVAHGQTHHY